MFVYLPWLICFIYRVLQSWQRNKAFFVHNSKDQSRMTSSTDISQDFEEVDDGYDDQLEQEQFDVGDEDIIDNDLEGEGGVEEEDEKQSGQEGLDLNMCDEDGNAYQDELDDQDECEGIQYQEQPYNQNNLCARDEFESHIQEEHSEGTERKVCDGDRRMKTENNDEGTLVGENGLVKKLLREKVNMKRATIILSHSLNMVQKCL